MTNNQTHLLTETPLPSSQYDAEVLRRQFEYNYDSIASTYPQYSSFNYLCLDNEDGTFNVILYGIGE